jgi:hypothetical protein
MATTLFESVRLSPEEAAELEARHPELAEGGQAARWPTLAIAAPAHVLEVVELLLQRLALAEARDTRVVDALAPDPAGAVISEERLQQLRLQAEVRKNFLESVDLLTSAMVAQLNDSNARNASALANRWKGEGRIFAVASGRNDLYPAFQFDAHGQPRPAVREVLRHLVESSDWGRALWWNSPSGWLGDRRPLEVLDEDPNAVVEAARRTAEPLQV